MAMRELMLIQRRFPEVGRRLRWPLILVIFVSLLFGLTEGIGIGLLAPLLDSAGTGSAFSELPVLGNYVELLQPYPPEQRVAISMVMLGVVILLRALTQFIQLRLFASIPNKLGLELIHATYTRVLDANLQFVNGRKTGEHTTTIMGLCDETAQAVATLSRIIAKLLLIAVYLTLIFMFSGELALVGILFLVAVAIATRKTLAIPTGRASARYISASIEFGNYLFEFIAGAQLIRLHAAQKIVRNQARKLLSHFKALGIIRETWLFVPSVAIPAIIGLLLCIGIALFAVFSEQPPETWIPQALLFIAVLFRLISPLSELSNMMTRLAATLPAISRLADYTDEASISIRPNGKCQKRSIDREVQFENVHFSYRTGRPVLKNVNLYFPKGQHIALVGKSGGGKSTIVNLLAGLYTCDHGRILIDGININDISLNEWSSVIGMVPQNPYFFNDTIRQNLFFGLPESVEAQIDADRLDTVLDMAGVKEFVSDLPEGLDTMVQAAGSRFSGGQKQRIAIARALLRDPSLLILDEATSQLDGLAQDELRKTIEQLPRTMTVVTIAHRLSTVLGSDLILVVDHGRIVGEGNHQQLLSTSNLYQRLVKTQELAV